MIFGKKKATAAISHEGARPAVEREFMVVVPTRAGDSCAIRIRAGWAFVTENGELRLASPGRYVFVAARGHWIRVMEAGQLVVEDVSGTKPDAEKAAPTDEAEESPS